MVRRAEAFRRRQRHIEALQQQEFAREVVDYTAPYNILMFTHNP